MIVNLKPLLKRSRIGIPNITRCNTMYCEDLRSCSDKDGYICGVTIASFIKRTIFDIADEAVNDIYSPNNKIYYNLPAHYSYSFLIQHNPEFVALGVVKLFHRFHKPQIPLLNQVQKTHTPAGISFCNADHQAQVSLHQLAARFHITF